MVQPIRINPVDPNPDEVNQWLNSLIEVIRETEKKHLNQNLTFGQEASTYNPLEQPRTVCSTNG